MAVIRKTWSESGTTSFVTPLGVSKGEEARVGEYRALCLPL